MQCSDIEVGIESLYTYPTLETYKDLKVFFFFFSFITLVICCLGHEVK